MVLLLQYFPLLLTIVLLLGLPTTLLAVENLTSQEVYDGIMAGRFDVIVDVRTPEEWETGHLPNATFMDSLAMFNTTGQVSTPNDLAGCEDGSSSSCVILVYCRSGNRAVDASRILEEHGFAVPVYNGLGVKQWTAAGYNLVNTSSTVPPCHESRQTTRDSVCTANMANTGQSSDSTKSPLSSSSPPPLSLTLVVITMLILLCSGFFF
jgi:rhodanese-related sulfurtransferase